MKVPSFHCIRTTHSKLLDTLGPFETNISCHYKVYLHPHSYECLFTTIEATVAVQTFRSQRGLALSLFRHCLISLATSLYAQSIISQEVYDTACNENKDKNQRCVALLDCVEARVGIVPLDFNKVLHILQSEAFLESLADRLIQTYRELIIQIANSLPCAFL